MPTATPRCIAHIASYPHVSVAEYDTYADTPTPRKDDTMSLTKTVRCFDCGAQHQVTPAQLTSAGSTCPS
jgi:hypothetical protein